MSDETAAVAVGADSFLWQPEPAARAASTDRVMSFLIAARHSLPESRRFSKPNHDEAKTRCAFQRVGERGKSFANQSSRSQAPSSKLEARAAVWSLELGISLVFGAWFLVFRFRDFSGAWSL